MPYLRSYRYPPALAYKHQLPFRLVHVHSTGDSDVAEMRHLLLDPEFRRNAMEVTTANLWHIAACFAYADGTFTTEKLYDTCTEYRPTALTTGEVPDIYRLPEKATPMTPSIGMVSKTPTEKPHEATSGAEASSVATVGTALSVAPALATATTTTATSRGELRVPTAHLELATPLTQPAPSGDDASPSNLVGVQETFPPEDPPAAASTKSASSTQSTPNVSPSKAKRGTHSRKASKPQLAAASPQPRMTTRAMQHAEELQQVLLESEVIPSQSSTTSSQPLVVVTVSAPTSQEPPQTLTVEDAPPETPSVEDAQAASASTDK